MENRESNKPISEATEIVLRDLTGLLQKKLGYNLIVDNFTTTNLVPWGENYGSTLLKVDALIRRGGQSSEPEELALAAKMIPSTEFQRVMFDSSYTFPKEIYMFQNIAPAYAAIEIECGIPKSEVYNGLPQLFGSRLSLKEGVDKFDKDAVILMENLRAKNYYCCDRFDGLDLAHSRMVVEELARFHALGIAVKFKKPVLFEEFKYRAKSMVIDVEKISNNVDKLMIKALRSIPTTLPYLSRIEEALDRCINRFHIDDIPSEPWGTIGHTDLWTNNVMFKKNASGTNPENIKFIDFQNYLYMNPLRDLLFLLFSSCIPKIGNAHFTELVDLYYQKFISHIGRLGINGNLFTRDAFDKQLDDAAHREYFHCMFMTRVISANPEAEASKGNPELMFQAKTWPQDCCNRMADITLQYVEKNWM
ncbi:uncharacterized protein LOC105692927 [Athalia rosae]|uniref:uncharacterized protein LOC105692927 n=1 Tax=Athalia rosae TaxID=37344 RepID=UPI002034A56F|nr:uncharacterized protein LOC105692927 [Athalia rosae]